VAFTPFLIMLYPRLAGVNNRCDFPISGQRTHFYLYQNMSIEFRGWILWARMGSNHQPTPYEGAALPLSYGPKSGRSLRLGETSETGAGAGQLLARIIFEDSTFSQRVHVLGAGDGIRTRDVSLEG
jgi:hypothetical protein